jgi:hypothetical protein
MIGDELILLDWKSVTQGRGRNLPGNADLFDRVKKAERRLR